LSLVREQDPQLPVWLRGDPLRLRQILLNLLSNAIKFTPRGSVYLRARLLTPPEAPLARLHIEVADTGIGMSRQQTEQLFQAFRQADSSVTRQYGGTGLGLAISKQLVSLMQGEIGVDSTPGKGSTFWFTITLPRAAPAPGPPADVAASAGLAGLRVLVVEDNLVNQMVISGMLAKLGVQTVLAQDGQEAVTLVQQQAEALDLVLMDCEMPVMDGYEATRRIRQWERQEGRPRLPILALTAHALGEHRAESRSAGMDDFLGKPVMQEMLIAKLAQWGRRPAKAGDG
jgi:CheY-like chemotaxis protein